MLKEEKAKYMRYKAYAQIRGALIRKMDENDVKKITTAELEHLLYVAYIEEVEKVINPEIGQLDDVYSMQEKKREINENQEYILMLKYAYGEYKNKFIHINRLTVKKIKKATEEVMKKIISDLLFIG